ncbi:acyl-CoA thioesterase [Cytobacillus gottheilii]|uniref:Acyl-CoA thioesterase n=1 Tax=Cytobacillus gottheilii TaxID=859144 RepID=A0ABX8F823_9BACI|nr:thioesterase family protein [Cytobacillus gottheilii]QVY60591.1 acyl-CoA thioesterase [Cytobacillus gottheilii]
MRNKTYIKDISQWEKEFSFFYETKVRFNETDMFGHLNNTVPFVYFESARIEFFKSLGFMQNWLEPEEECIPVVADLQCDFVQQVFFDEQLKIYVKAAAIGGSSVDIHYMGKNNKEDTVLTGRGTMVQISKKTGKGVPWTEEMREMLAGMKREPVDEC